MRYKLTKDEFTGMWEFALGRLEAAADRLNRLDAAAGDGDLGVTVTLGSKGARKALPDLADQDIGNIVARSGMAFNSTAPSTFGALFAIGAMRAGREAKGAEELDLPLLARMASAAEAGIAEKGKAARGDKTCLDALGPVATSLGTSAAEGLSLEEALHSATEAARAGVESTSHMVAKSGRAAWIAERSAGQPDPGATAFLVLVEAVDEFVKGLG